MESLQFFQNPFFQWHLLLTLCSREEVKYINAVKLRTNTVDTTDTLHDTGRVPRKVIVHKDIGTMQVDTFCQYIGSDKKIVFIIVFIFEFRIKTIFNFNLQCSTALSAEIDNSFSVDFLQFLIQILCCFCRFGKNNRFFSFHLGIRCKIALEFIQLRICFNQRPNELHGFQLRQICLQITEELRRKLLRFKFHDILLFNQIHQLLCISIILKVIHIYFLADINLSGPGHFNEFLIRFNKTIQGLTKSVKTALQAFYKDSLHKAAHIVLSSKHRCILLFIFQIQQRCITSIFEILDNIDRLRKSIIRFLIK